jgi:hypothetical protein
LQRDLALVPNTALLIANSFAPGNAPATAYRDHRSLTCTPSHASACAGEQGSEVCRLPRALHHP